MIEPITQQLQRFADDERAVSPVVGFVLIFALIMIVFTVYQAEVVPAQNAEVEFKHSQTVEADMSQLNDAIQETGASGVPQSVTVATGVQYPNRAFAINPGAPAGTLETVDAPDVKISGLSGGSGYWSDGQTFNTSVAIYQSNYNILQQETKYVLENGMVVKNFENGNTLLQSNGSVISNEGRRINLVLVDDSYQKSAITTSMTVRPVSTSTRYLQLNATGPNPSITIPTTLSENQWTEMLDGKVHVNLKDHLPAGTFNKTILGLDTGKTYELRISKVTLGSPDSPKLKYLKSEDARTNRTAAVGVPETFTVSARDEFGNPVAGATVDANTSGSGTFARSNGTSVDTIAANDGRVTFSYTPSAADAGNTTTVAFILDNGSGDTDLDTVSYNITIPDNNDTSDPNEIGGDIDNGYALPESRRVTIDSATASGNSVEFEFNNRGDMDMTVTQIQFSGYVGHFPSSSFATGGRFADTDIELNGQTVTLNSPFTVGTDDSTTATLSDLDVNKVQTGLLIVSVKYEYTEDGTTKTDTATYSVPVLK